ncbi:MAG TPA: hypothetical protein VJA23_04510 [Candidatus Nanoarchaeia archaeon]|nr:hypothetical protein [Candidatus Nanoarchaeia archaeon]
MAIKEFPTNEVLGHQSEHWGIERIVLDCFSNHLSSDSGAQQVSINFVDRLGQFISYERRAELKFEEVEAIVIEDDGIGFPNKATYMTYSDKDENLQAIGEKGEGLKKLLKACLELGIDAEVRSTSLEDGQLCSWQGNYFTKPERFRNRPIKAIYSRISDLPPAEKTGSLTTFKNLTPELFRFFQRSLEQKVLLLRPDQSRRYKGKAAEIVDEAGLVFIKGVYISDEYRRQLGFTYDFRLLSPNRDRNNVKPNEIRYGLRKFLDELADLDIIKRLVKFGEERRSLLEFEVLSADYEKRIDPEIKQQVIVRVPEYGIKSIPHFELWKNAFYELYSQRAALSSSEGRDSLAKLNGYRVLDLESHLASFLGNSGVLKTNQLKFNETDFLLRDERYASLEEVRIFPEPTSFTLDYGRINWGALRIMLDTVSNHVDSGGSLVKIEYQVKRGKSDEEVELPIPEAGFGQEVQVVLFDEKTDSEINPEFEWVSQGEINQRGQNEKIYAIRVSDNGIGYEMDKKLPLLFSDKPIPVEGTEYLTGGFGEGAKMVTLAILREQLKSEENRGINIKFRSQDCAGVPVANPITVGRTNTHKVHFVFAKNLETIVGSKTTIYEPTAEICNQFRKISEFVLKFNSDYSPLHADESGELFNARDYPGKNSWYFRRLFANGFYIQDSYKENVLFDYNLRVPITKISPDRDNIDIEIVKSKVGQLVRTCKNKEVLEKIVKAATTESDTNYFEFVEVDADAERLALWKESFRKLYGEKAVLSTGSSHLEEEAVYRGYRVIKCNSEVSKTLYHAGVLRDADVVSAGIEKILVPEENLTDAEKKMLALIPSIDRAIMVTTGNPLPPPTVKICSQFRTRDGKVDDTLGGLFDPSDGTIYIKRSQLAQPKSFILIYDHERGHQITGNSDTEAGFRGFFEELGYYYVSGEVQGENGLSGELYRLQQELVQFDAQRTRLTKLEKVNSDLQYRLWQLSHHAERFLSAEERDTMIKMEHPQEKTDYLTRKLGEARSPLNLLKLLFKRNV